MGLQEQLSHQLVGFLGVINMAKKKINFDFEKENSELDALGKQIGITEDDMRDVATIRAGRPGQAELAKESEERDRRHAIRNRGLDQEGTTSIPNAEIPGSGYAAQLKSVVDRFKSAPAGAEKEKHRATAWAMAEGIKRDSGPGFDSEARTGGRSGTRDDADLTPGRRTAIRFVPGQEMPCVNGRCHNTVPYDGPKHEPEGSPVTAGITTCSGGKCNIPGAVASRPAER